MILVAGRRELLQIVLALRPPCRLAGLLHGRQKQRNQDRNNCDHHQKFDQCESVRSSSRHGASTWKKEGKLPGNASASRAETSTSDDSADKLADWPKGIVYGE